MAWRLAGGCMTQSITHGDQFVDLFVQLVGFCQEQRSVDFRAFGCKHFTDFIERKAGASPQ
jgi:hypothetical protein